MQYVPNQEDSGSGSNAYIIANPNLLSEFFSDDYLVLGSPNLKWVPGTNDWED